MITCKGCEKRYIGCHDKCEAYLEFKEERALISKNRQLEKIVRQHSSARKKDMINTHRKNF